MTPTASHLRSVGQLIKALTNVPPRRLLSRARYELKGIVLRSSPRRLREAMVRANEEPPAVRSCYLLYRHALALDGRDDGGQAGGKAVRPTLEMNILGESFELSDPIDWTAPGKDRLWRFTLHYFDWAIPLVGSALVRKATARDEAAGAIPEVEAVQAAMQSWIRANSYPLSDAWHPYTTARRLTAWTHLTSTFPELAVADVERSMWLQLRHLADNVEWFAGGGHLLQNLSSLVVAGLRYEGQKAERIVRKALHDLCIHLPRQILADGCHYELSSTYHLQNMTRTSEVIACLLSAGYRPPNALVDSLERMTRFAESIRLPSNDYPVWSDAVRDSVHAIDVVIGFSNAVLGTCGQTGPTSLSDPPVVDFERLPFPFGYLVRTASTRSRFERFPNLRESRGASPGRRSGLHVLRSGEVSVAFDTSDTGAPDLPGHGHADCLSFDLWLGDQPVIVESGTSTYADNADRTRERGTAAHNTIQVGSHDQSELWGSFRAGRIAVAIDQAAGATAGWSWASGGHDGYRRPPLGTTHRRWLGTRGGDVVILDQLVMDAGALEAEFGLRMHLAPQVMAHECGGETLRLTVGDDEIWVSFLGLEPEDTLRVLDAATSGSFLATGMGRRTPRGLIELRGQLRPGDSKYLAVAFSWSEKRYQLRVSRQDVWLSDGAGKVIGWRKGNAPLIPVAPVPTAHLGHPQDSSGSAPLSSSAMGSRP